MFCPTGRNKAKVVEPSSRVGTNSAPNRRNRATEAMNSTTAPQATQPRPAMPNARTREYSRWSQRMSAFSVSFTDPPKKNDASTGMRVMAKTSAPPRASITVRAIGWNIFPSTPVSERIGK